MGRTGLRVPGEADAVTADHYATLGVAPTTEDVVIRAAYLALMRRYHPDTNASPAAAARVRAITAAYKVLSDQDKRADYDRKRAAPAGIAPPIPIKDFPVGQIVFGLILLLLVPLLALALRSSPSPPHSLDRPARAQSGGNPAPVPDAAMVCASQAIQDKMKRELFRRAARLRRSDPVAFEAFAAQSLVRIDAPAIAGGRDDRGALNCTASVVIDLPPGVSAAGNRTLVGDVGYAVRAGSVAGGDAVILYNGDMIARPLSTLVPRQRPADDLNSPPDLPDPLPLPMRPRLAEPPVVSKPSPAPPPALLRPKARADPKPAKPLAGTSSPVDLAALDRHVALLTDQSLRYGDAAKQAALLRTRSGFLARRQACRSDSCLRNAYLDRMQEVAAIMTDQPQPAR